MDTKTNNRLMVYVRVRPVNDGRSIVDIVDDTSLIFDPMDTENEPTDEYYYHGKKYKSIGTKKKKNVAYSFDRVFDSFATNYSLYETITRPMVEATLNGLNCSVFAYGATGSGKTYTMLGTPSCPGVIYYTSKDLFGKLAAASQTDPLPAELKICYFEIYNEKIRDLLVSEQTNYINCGNKRLRTTPERCRARQHIVTRDNCNLPVCDNASDGSLVIPDLTYHVPTNAEELLDLLETGNTNRSQHPTDANADSSRSHAIFQIVLTRRTRSASNNGNTSSEYELQTSKMSLIDLAGSERATVAYRAGNDRSKNLQREGGNINKSLLALGNCINALADPRQNQKYIPYRNSKLTRLLRDSLGGKCRTAMIATLCQQPSHYDDTQNTLIYASRAKCIKLRPGRNFTDIAIQPKNYNIIIDNQNQHIAKLQSENDKLKMELDELKNQLAIQQRVQMSRTFSSSINSTNSSCNNNNPVDKSQYLETSYHRRQLDQLYDERYKIRMELLQYESKFRMNELKQVFKKLDDSRNQIINGELPKMNGNITMLLETKSITASLSNYAQLRAQLEFYDQERSSLVDKAKMNEIHIRDTLASMTSEFEVRGYGSSDEFDQLIEPYLREKETGQELEEKVFSEQHAYDVAQDGMNKLMTTENLLVEAAYVIRYIQAIIKGRGLSDLVEAKLAQMLKKLEGKKNVVWKDDKYESENNTNEPMAQLLSVHDNFSLNFLTPFKNNNTLHSRRLSKNLVSLSNYTPEQSNTTFDASH